MANYPKDLIIHPEFIDKEEERKLINAIRRENWSTELSRRTQHYGYEYHYYSRNINPAPQIPDWGKEFIEKLIESKIVEQSPDQIIVNEYKPGQGIREHVDNIQKFGDVVISLSLKSACEFKFINTKNKNITWSIYLQPRTLVIMKGESRYQWMHKIPAVKYDLIDNQCINRRLRISITLRYIKKMTMK